MKNCVDTHTEYNNKCLVITSSHSLNCYPRLPLSLIPHPALLYPCFEEKSAISIPFAQSYEVILDFDNPEIESIIISLFNKLLPISKDISVIAAHCVSQWNSDTAPKLVLLKKLRDHMLIRLEILSDPEAAYTHFPINTIENTVCFIGPGNTGKTSIVSSISEAFYENNHSVALLDLTQIHKLVNYYTDSINISSVLNSYTECGHWDIPYSYVHFNEFISLYTFDDKLDEASASPILLYKFIEYLSTIYDQVVINADYQTLDRFQNIFKCINKLFIVYDLTPTKIDVSYQLMLKLNSLGLTKKDRTSIIYNKVERRASDIQYFEENVIFDKSIGNRLTPLIDVQCNTFEIPYSKGTMAALLNKFRSQKPILSGASRGYIKNIVNIYKLINNIQYQESYDMQFNEFILYWTEKLKNFIPSNLLKYFGKIFSKEKINILNDFITTVLSRFQTTGK